MLHGQKDQIRRPDIVEVVEPVLTGVEGRMHRISGMVNDPPGRSVVGVLDAGPIGHHCPEIVEHMAFNAAVTEFLDWPPGIS